MASWIKSITVSIYMRIGMGSLCVVVMRSPVIIGRALRARLLLLPQIPCITRVTPLSTTARNDSLSNCHF